MICIDVLEHINEPEVPWVLSEVFFLCEEISVCECGLLPREETFAEWPKRSLYPPSARVVAGPDSRCRDATH